MNAFVTVDSDGKVSFTAKFRKSFVNVFGNLAVNTFIDARHSTPGYYHTDGLKKDAVFTVSAAGDTAIDPAKNHVRYVTSMAFPVSKDKSVYHLWIYINSNVIGIRFCAEANTDGGKPNESNINLQNMSP